jgi:hypothetical protein
MLNNITNFLNLIVNRKIKDKVTIADTDLIPLGTRDPRFGGDYQPTAITFAELKDAVNQGVTPGPVCDITMEPQTITFGPEVYFVHPTGSSITVRDIINPGVVEITRDNAQGIFNAAAEGNYNFGVSPKFTGWNAGGWGDLSDIADRVYDDWRTCILNAFGNIPSQVGQELVMIDYITGKYYTIKFDYWQAGGGGGFSYYRQEIFVSEKCEITFSDGTKQNTAAGEVEAGSGINVMKTINEDGTITYTVSNTSAGVNYSNVAFVDPQYGDDTTGLVGRFDKPFYNVNTARAAVQALGPTPAAPGLVYIRKGEQYSSITLAKDIYIYAEAGVTLYGGLFSYTLNSGDYTKFFGHGEFRYISWILNANTTGGILDIAFDNADYCGGFYNCNFAPVVRMNCDWMRLTGLNGGAYCNRVTDNADIQMNIKYFLKGQHSLFLLRNGNIGPFAGKLRVNCPLLELIEPFYANYGNVNRAIIQTSPCGPCDVEINGVLKMSATAHWPALTFQNHYVGGNPSKFVINGPITAPNNHCIWTGFVGWFVDVRVTGDLISNTSPINCYLNNTNADPGPSYITIRDSKIIGYANILGVSRYIKFMNCSFYNYADGVTFPTAPNISWQNDQLGQIKRADFYNCISQANGASSEFMENAGAGLTEITLVGCYGNKPVGTGLVPTFSDYVQVPSLKVLNRV